MDWQINIYYRIENNYFNYINSSWSQIFYEKNITFRT